MDRLVSHDPSHWVLKQPLIHLHSLFIHFCRYKDLIITLHLTPAGLQLSVKPWEQNFGFLRSRQRVETFFPIEADVEGHKPKVKLAQTRCYWHRQSGATRGDGNNEKPNNKEPLLLFIIHNQPMWSERWDTSLMSTLDVPLDISQGTWAPVSSHWRTGGHWLKENDWTQMMTDYIITGDKVTVFACTLFWVKPDALPQ